MLFAHPICSSGSPALWQLKPVHADRGPSPATAPTARRVKTPAILTCCSKPGRGIVRSRWMPPRQLPRQECKTPANHKIHEYWIKKRRLPHTPSAPALRNTRPTNNLQQLITKRPISNIHESPRSVTFLHNCTTTSIQKPTPCLTS